MKSYVSVNKQQEDVVARNAKVRQHHAVTYYMAIVEDGDKVMCIVVLLNFYRYI
jgi:hypothetical protein